MTKNSNAFFLGIDQGTQSSRAIIFDHTGEIVSAAQAEVSISKISPVEIEQNGVEILCSITSCLLKLFRDVNPERIKAAGLATQRSSIIAWESYNEAPLSPILSWRDRRATDFVDSLRSYEKLIQGKTGLRLSPYYGASKIRWLLRNNAAVQNALKEKNLNVGPLASYLIFSLCGNHPYLVDHANALRTQLLNLQILDWDKELFELFELPFGLLPKPVPTNFYYGELNNTAIPLKSVNGDQTAAMYSLGQMGKGEVLVNLGTGGFVLCPVDENTETPYGMLGGLSASNNRTSTKLLEGTVNGCGSALNWYREILGNRDQFDIDNCLRHFKGEIVFSNGIGGLGSPYWKNIQPEFFRTKDLQKIDNPDPSQAVAAIIESILFLVQINTNQISKVIDIKAIRLSGGLANNQRICQLLADLSTLEVTCPDITEATARGAAWLASGFEEPWTTGQKTQYYTPAKNNSLQARFDQFRKVYLSRSLTVTK